MEKATEEIKNLKPVKGIEDWSRKQYRTKYIYYRRKGAYAICHCSECGARYEIRAVETGDMFQDAAMDIEKPERDKPTKCRNCKAKALYKPAGKCKPEWHYEYVVSGERMTDDKFAIRIFDTRQIIRADHETVYDCMEVKRILLEKGKKPTRYEWNHCFGWIKSSCGEQFRYFVHPRAFREVKKTGMFKYVPIEKSITNNFIDDCWFIDYYIAAARYPDFEMILKMGLTEYADRLVHKYPTNFNPRGKTIENRLRIYKSRIPDMIKTKGSRDSIVTFQLEKRLGQHWTDEDLEILKVMKENHYDDKYITVLKYTSLKKFKNYMIKQKMWPNPKDKWQKSSEKRNLRSTYYDYLHMKEAEGYDMTDEITLFPKDIRRRHDEMVLEREKKLLDTRKKEVLKKYPKIKSKYKSLSEKYSAAAGGYIIRPAKDAAEIVVEGRVLHHCVGGDNYLSKHNTGKSFILFLRPIESKDIPFITVEIKDNEVVQWYGAYDRKPNENMFSKWLKTYCKELKKHEKTNCTGTTKKRRTA